VDLVDDRGAEPMLIGAVAPAGVVAVPMAERLALASSAVLVEFTAPNSDAVLDAALSQVGKPYDWLGVAGIALRGRDWQEDDCWFCSELVAWAFSEAGYPLFRTELQARITPQHLWMLANPKLTAVDPMELLLQSFGKSPEKAL
jgi:cell wall-associated NlpC family hydrolase